MRRVIAPLLIVGAAVGGTQVERVIRAQIRLHAEGDAHEPARAFRRVRRGAAGDLRLDRAVAELEVVQGRKRLRRVLPHRLWGRDDLQPGLSLKRVWRQNDAMGGDAAGGVQEEVPGLLGQRRSGRCETQAESEPKCAGRQHERLDEQPGFGVSGPRFPAVSALIRYTRRTQCTV